jgi:hypothetical protein
VEFGERRRVSDGNGLPPFPNQRLEVSTLRKRASLRDDFRDIPVADEALRS